MIAPLLLGILSSLHCMGMCGPIALALPVHQMTVKKKTFSVILYHLGRISTYVFLGTLFGILGKGLFIAGLQQNVSVLLGILLIISVVLFRGKIFKTNLFVKNPLFVKLKQSFGKFFGKKTLFSFYMIGILNGFLPCAMVYMALFGALSTQGFFYGALFMFFYGLGTVPLLSFVVWFGQKISNEKKKLVQKIIPFFLVLIGLFLIVRGLGLDIPYLSPATLQLFITGNPQCF